MRGGGEKHIRRKFMINFELTFVLEMRLRSGVLLCLSFAYRYSISPAPLTGKGILSLLNCFVPL